jgi:tetratricopeptide (TPR) repeat protein
VARAAVKAKQAQKAQAQVAAKPSHGRRKHAGGGNPNQDLFFTRLRRRQKWVFLLLALVFAISFVALGVGSGGGGGLEQSIVNYLQNAFGGGNDAISKANKEIKTNPKKGYQDLARAYVAANNVQGAILALQQYLTTHKTDASTWTLLAGYETTQASTFQREYQQVAQSAQIESPGTSIAPTGPLQGLFPTGPLDTYLSTQGNAQVSPLAQNASAGYNNAMKDYQQAAKYAKQSGFNQGQALTTLALFAQRIQQTTVARNAWRRFLTLKPHVSNLKQIESLCKQQLGGPCVPKNATPKHKTK